MKIVLSWLKDYIDIQYPPEKIAEALMMAGFEVESIIQPGKNISGVVVGRILTQSQHPNADKLTLCTVDAGRSEPLTIVCGATNMKVGDRVPVAVIGATLPSGFQIRKAKIRGHESFGMMCSQQELGLGEDHAGLFLLPEDAPIGEDIVSYLGLDEVTFEVNVTPNRGDALSHLGIARELSAIFNLPLEREALEIPLGTENVHSLTSVEIKNLALCPRYGARVVRGIRVGPSPQWLTDRLERAGVRAINNVVDITNYVMLAIGHPMHAFDLQRLTGHKIIVRNAAQGEMIQTLDTGKRQLDPTMLVIADAERPIAVAGVMGGAASGVTPDTSDVLLEAAFFDPITVRRTAKILGVNSESSYRFERGTNIDNVPIALNMATSLLNRIAGGSTADGLIDVYPRPAPLRQIQVRSRRVMKVLGIEMTPPQIETILLRLKLEVRRDGDILWIGVPPYRNDLEQEADIIEEIARIYGYNRIPETLPAISTVPLLPTPIQKLEHRVRDHLASLGFNEIMTYSFVPSHIPASFEEKRPFVLRNPLSEELANMRTSLTWGMYEAIRRNVMADEYDLRLFEVGRSFQPASGSSEAEQDRLCIGLSGAENPSDWRRSSEPFDLHRIKGLVESIGRLVGQTLSFRPNSKSLYHPTRQFEIFSHNRSLGHLGQIHPSFLDTKKMPEGIFFVEIDLSLLASLPRETPRMAPIPEFPPVRRDLAFVLPRGVAGGDIANVCRAEGGALLESCLLFDVYAGKGIEPGKRSLAFALSFRHAERTLTDAEVQPLIDAIVTRIGQEFQGQLRQAVSVCCSR